MKKNTLKPVVFATLLALSGSVLAATALEGSYKTINTPDGFTLSGTATSEDGKFVTSGSVQDINAGSNLYLSSENAEITNNGGMFFVGENAQIKQNADSNLTNLTYTGGRLALSGSDLVVENTMSFSSARPEEGGSYVEVINGGSLTVDHFVANTYYSINNSHDGLGGTVTIRDLDAAGLLSNEKNGVFNITETANIGHFWNMGTVNAQDAIVEISPQEGMLPVDYDGTTVYKHADGKTYVLGNGIDKDQTMDGASKASMSVGSLIVHGNAINTAGSDLNATNLQVEETLRNDNSSTINLNGGVADVGNVVGDGGIINLTQATFIAQGASNFGTVTANQSEIALNGGENTITSFSGEGKTIWLNSTDASLTIGTKTGTMSVNTTGAVNDQHANVQETLNWLNNAVVVESGERVGDDLVIMQGDVNDGMVLRINEKGEYEVLSVQKNTLLDAYGSVSALGIMQWRHEMNDLSKRMGELRDSPEGVGAWARIYGSEQEYGAQDVTSKNTSVQVGADFDVGSGWKVGAAFTYTDGSSDYHGGDADNKAYSLAAYGTWMAENGQFVDLVAKYSRLSTDFDLNAMDGDYDNNAFSVSAEYGWHLRFNESFFVEPQVEVTYGQVKGETAKTSNGVRLEQDDFDSLIGRVGVRAGFHFPKDKGTIYARVSGLHDFQGDYDVTATKGKAVNDFSDDLGDTWVEFGLGANFNWTDNTYTYVDLERSNGGEIKENWRWNIGLRHVF